MGMKKCVQRSVVDAFFMYVCGIVETSMLFDVDFSRLIDAVASESVEVEAAGEV